MDLSIVIVSYNTCVMTCECIESILDRTTGVDFEIIVIDNNSTDSSAKIISQRFPSVLLIHNKANYGFSYANNQGIRIASGDFIFLLNSDTVVFDNSIEYLLGYAKAKGIQSAVAPVLLNEDLSLQKSFYNYPNLCKIILNTTGFSPHVRLLLNMPIVRSISANLLRVPQTPISVLTLPDEFRSEYVLFASIMLHRSLINEVGLLDENMPFYHEDCEYGYRLKNMGKSLWVYSGSQIVHYGGGSSRLATQSAYRNYFVGLIYFYRKYYSSFSCFALLVWLKLLFGTKALLSLLGGCDSLCIPSNYRQVLPSSSFASQGERIKYYISLLLL